jgi:hypothetical protein
MPYRKLSGAHYCKNGHSLGSAVNSGSPSLAKQQQDGRDQRTGVTDTYPPYEVGNVPTPANGAIQVPLTGTIDYFGSYRDNAEQE